MAMTMRNQFGDGRRERTTDVVQISGKPTGGKMVRGIQRHGNDPLSSLSNRPFGDVQVPREEYVPEGEPLYNAPYAHTRRIHPLGPQHDSLDQFELGLLHKRDMSQRGTGHNDGTRTSYMQTAPVNSVNPATFNFLLAQQQLLLQAQDERAYQRLTAQDLWQDWTLDGVVEHANVVDAPGQGDQSTSMGAKKQVTMIVENGVYVYNYWARCGLLVPGSTLCLVLKRMDVRDNQSDGQARYWLNHGYGTGGALSGNGGANASTLNFNARAGGARGETQPFKPFQLGFFVLPYGGAVPRDVLHYTDEYDVSHYDALVIRLGHVAIAPRQQQAHVLMPAHTHTPMQRVVEAWRDSNVGVGGNLTQLKLMMNCDDGATPL